METFFSLYLGQEKEKGYSGFIAEGNFFCILEVNDDSEPELGKQVLHQIGQKVKSATILNLAELDHCISQSLQNTTLPIGFSLSAGYRIGDIFYLKTIGDGEVLLRRGNIFTTLLTDNNNASGRIEINDLFIFSTRHFTEELHGGEELEKIFDHKKPAEIVETLTPIMKGKEDSGAISLFVQFGTQITEQNIPTQSVEDINRIKEVPPPFLRPSALLSPILRHKKKVVIGIGVILLTVLFILNSGRLFVQKKQIFSMNSFEKVNEEVRQNIDEANGLISSDIQSAARLFDKSETLLKQYTQQTKTKQSNVADLELFLQNKKNELLRIKQVSSEEFFDLKIEDEKAKGEILSLYGDTVAILNKAGSVYLFSLDKKSIKRVKKTEFVNADMLTYYENLIYIYRKLDGIYQVDADGKIKKVIAKDNEWGKPVALQVYNANLYMVDAETDDIYKYVGGESGFADRVSYLQSGKPDLTNAHSIAIDISLYVGLSDGVLKYLSGVKDDFILTFPKDESKVKITKVLATKDSEFIYVWEKENGSLTQFEKNGSYKGELQSSALSKVSDLIIYRDKAYGIMGSKIITLSSE